MAQGLEGRSEGSKVSPTEAPTPGESPQPEVGSSGVALPLKTAPHRERVLEAMCEILARVHALHLQTMHEMGSMQELDQTLAQTLLAESARLHLIIGEDFTKSLIALHTDLEASCQVLFVRHCEDLESSPRRSCISLGEGYPPKVPAGHLTEGEPAPGGAGGSPGKHGGIPVEPPQRNKLPNRVPGAN